MIATIKSNIMEIRNEVDYIRKSLDSKKNILYFKDGKLNINDNFIIRSRMFKKVMVIIFYYFNFGGEFLYSP